MKSNPQILNFPSSINEFPYHFTLLDIDEIMVSNHAGIYLFVKKIKSDENNITNYKILSYGESENFHNTLLSMKEEEKIKGSSFFCHLECSNKEEIKKILIEVGNFI
ncbi:hypothetical protein ACFOW1_05855 [Parasediminibacterium paludis]|uniref:Uncharacterized protein n=1 Tax=Parasediminibacterium paludis TaxID=908966 RepID=A0ABV8PVY5_9BACT